MQTVIEDCEDGVIFRWEGKPAKPSWWWRLRDFVPYRLERQLERKIVEIRERSGVNLMDGDSEDDAKLKPTEAWDIAEEVSAIRAVALTLEWGWDAPVSEEGLLDLPRECVIDVFKWARDKFIRRTEEEEADLKKESS